MLVKEAMNKHVKTIRSTNTLVEAAKMMNDNHIGSLVVVAGPGNVVGIITERDVLKSVAAGKVPTDIKVEDIMSKNLITIEPYRTLEDAADVMTKNRIKKLPVIDNGRLVGIITTTDLIAYEKNLIETVATLLVRSHPSKLFGG